MRLDKWRMFLQTVEADRTIRCGTRDNRSYHHYYFQYMKTSMIDIRIVAAMCAALNLAGCASTEVTRWAAPPGKEVLIGQGGAVQTVKAGGRDIDMWIEGSPNRPFKILAKTVSTYQHGTVDRAMAIGAAKGQMAEAAAKAGGDAVIMGSESSESVGTVYVPGQQTTVISAPSRNSLQATTSSNPSFAASAGRSGTIHAYIVKYVDQ